MKAQLVSGNVRTNCPTCDGAITTYEYTRGSTHREGDGYGTVIAEHAGQDYTKILYKLLCCAGCGKGGMAEIYIRSNMDWKTQGVLGRFYPYTIDKHPLPAPVPDEIKKEFEEAEICASVEAWRAASAMLRSVLEKTLKANGYDDKRSNLQQRIDQAVADGVITEARSRRAHANIRVLGNDILHEPWREVKPDEYDDAHLYAQRVLEDFYDDRSTVEGILITKKRLPLPPSPPPSTAP
jgi:Domain of unknown function (DUF4145)